jgi:hypothetical protein
VNGKVISIETIPEIRRGMMKENGGALYIRYIVKTFVNVTMCPHPAQQ